MERVMALPTAVPLMVNCTVPAGVALPVLGETVAVRVMAVPTATGEVGEEVSAVVVAMVDEAAPVVKMPAKLAASIDPHPVARS